MAATLQLPAVRPQQCSRRRRASTCCSAEPSRCDPGTGACVSAAAACALHGALQRMCRLPCVLLSRPRLCRVRRTSWSCPLPSDAAAARRVWTPTSARPEAARLAQSTDRASPLLSLSGTAGGRPSPVVARRGEEPPNPMVMERFQSVISSLFQQVRLLSRSGPEAAQWLG